MAKRKQQPPDEGSPAWMATFSDLMNLLLCFFVLLFASSTMDAGKLQKIAASFDNISFSILPQGSVSLVDGAIVSGGVTQLPGIESILEYVGKASEATGNNVDQQTSASDGDGHDSSSQSDGQSTENMNGTISGNVSMDEMLDKMEQTGMNQSEEMYEEVTDMVESYSIEDKVDIDFTSQYVQLDLNGAILFDSGDAELKDDAKFLMQKVASILVKYKDCIIEIEGHTDNVPIGKGGKYESNRYLSTARATKVYEYIISQENLIDENIKIAGYGESRPIESNDTPEGRAKNRRVVIKIYNQLKTEQSLE